MSAAIDDLVQAFLERYGAGDLEGLGRLLRPSFRLVGPGGVFASCESYLGALRRDPPVPRRIAIDGVVADRASALVRYRLLSPDRELDVAQHFEASEGRLGRSLLVCSSPAHRRGRRVPAEVS